MSTQIDLSTNMVMHIASEINEGLKLIESHKAKLKGSKLEEFEIAIANYLVLHDELTIKQTEYIIWNFIYEQKLIKFGDK